jgi:nucleoside-diphosphate-sugar epimerase
MSSSQTVLITGATGFLGSHLTFACLRAGYNVIILKRRTSRLDRIKEILDQIQCFDIEDGVEQPFKLNKGIDAVLHTATCYGRSQETPLEVFEANTVFPLRLLQTAVLFNVDTFFNTDTILYKYLNSYALSKNHFMEWGQSFSITGHIRFLNIRLEHMYGPGDDASKFTTHVIRSCLANVPELKLTAGEQKRDFIFIDDVISAYLLLLEKHCVLNKNFITFELGSGKAISIRSFVESVHHISESRTKLDFGSIPYREGEIMESKADISALEKLGWCIHYNIEEALRLTIDQEKGKS